MTARLRVSHLIVQPVLVWDDGEDFTPGPTPQPINVTLSQVPEMVAALPGEVAKIEASLAEADPKLPEDPQG